MYIMMYLRYLRYVQQGLLNGPPINPPPPLLKLVESGRVDGGSFKGVWGGSVQKVLVPFFRNVEKESG